MALPKLSYPTFEVIIPSSGEKVKMRPFVVREEKILLMAQAGGDPLEIVNAIRQVINLCIVTEVNTNQFTTFDIEYLFVKLRAKSVNNIIDILYKDPEDEKQYKISINLDDVEIKKNPEHSTNIEITKDLGIIMKYPPLDIGEKLKDVNTEIDLFFKLIKECVEKIYDKETVYSVGDYSEEEVEEFISTLDVNAFKKIQKFFDTVPKIYYEALYKTEAGVEKKVVLQNLNDFF
jgi:hypothetical protein